MSDLAPLAELQSVMAMLNNKLQPSVPGGLATSASTWWATKS